MKIKLFVQIKIIYTFIAQLWIEHRISVPKDLGSNPNKCNLIKPPKTSKILIRERFTIYRINT